MKILHAPINIAGQLTEISRAQRKLGFTSDVMVFNQGNFKYDCDINLKTNLIQAKIIKAYKIFANFFKCLLKYDVFHFHYGRTLLPYGYDLPVLRFFGKKLVMQYWGTDVIQYDIAAKYTLFPEKDMDEIFHQQTDADKRKKIAQMEKKVDVTIVGDPALLPYTPKSKVIAKAINLEETKFVGLNPKAHVLKIVHAPSNRAVKGTDHIIKAISKLKTEGFKFEFIIVEKKSNAEAMKIYAQADLIIDDVLQGPYGILSMEAMALGKPVMVRIDPKLVDFYPGLPVINVDSSTIYEETKKILENPTRLKDLSLKSRAYMEKNHDINKIAQEFIDLYESL